MSLFRFLIVVIQVIILNILPFSSYLSKAGDIIMDYVITQVPDSVPTVAVIEDGGDIEIVLDEGEALGGP